MYGYKPTFREEMGLSPQSMYIGCVGGYGLRIRALRGKNDWKADLSCLKAHLVQQLRESNPLRTVLPGKEMNVLTQSAVSAIKFL